MLSYKQKYPKAFRQGFTAGKAGLPSTKNPYSLPRGVMHDGYWWWEKGYIAGSAKRLALETDAKEVLDYELTCEAVEKLKEELEHGPSST